MTSEILQSRLQSLKSFYIRLASPAAILFVLAYVLRKLQVGPLENETLGAIGGPVVFILAAVLALAIPIFHRGLFAHRIRGEQSVPITRYISFQKTQIALAVSAAYAALTGFLFDIARFHFLGAIFFALYGLYYYYPSEKRIRHEMRIFRAEEIEAE